jgi:hypothetical protein
MAAVLNFLNVRASLSLSLSLSLSRFLALDRARRAQIQI